MNNQLCFRSSFFSSRCISFCFFSSFSSRFSSSFNHLIFQVGKRLNITKSGFFNCSSSCSSYFFLFSFFGRSLFSRSIYRSTGFSFFATFYIFVNTAVRYNDTFSIFVELNNSTFASSDKGASAPNLDLLFVLIQKVSKNLIN